MMPIRNPNWVVALNDLDYNHRNAFAYFYLKEPPKQGEEQYHYNFVQKRIKEKVGYISNFRDLDLKQEKQQLKTYLEEKKKESLELESHLYDQVLRNIGKSKNKNDYILMCEKYYTGKIGKKGVDLVKNTTLENMSPWEFWTKAANNLLGGQEELKNKIKEDIDYAGYFAMTIWTASEELYNLLKSQGQQDFFSRHAAVSGREEKIEGDKIDNAAIDALTEGMVSFVQEQVDPMLIGEDSEVEQALQKLIGYSREAKRKRIKGEKISASAYSKKAREISKEILIAINKTKPKTQEIKEISLSTEEGKMFFYIGSTPNVLYLSYKGIKGIQDLREQAVDENGKFSYKIFDELMKKSGMTTEVVKTILNTIMLPAQGGYSYKTDVLHLLSLGPITITDYFDSFEDFAQKLTLGKTKLIESIERYATSDRFYKSFMAINNNAYISGLLGEIAAYFNIDNLKIGNRYTQLTGNIYANNSGFSSNDIRVGNLGVNVKHYMYAGSTLSLYDDGKWLSIKNDSLRTYLGWEDLQLMRFVAANAYFFDGNKQEMVENIAMHTAMHNITAFYRIQIHNKRGGTNDEKNVLFVLNNIVYPTSYVYHCALQQLDEYIEEDKRNEEAAFFDVKVTSNNNFDAKNYKNLGEAWANYNLEDYRIRNIYEDLNTNIQIKTKGLKINLMSLALFSE